MPDDLRNDVLNVTCISHKICEDTSLKDAFDLINSARGKQREDIPNGRFMDKNGQGNTDMDVDQITWLSSLQTDCFNYAMEIQREIMIDKEEIKQVATPEQKQKEEIMIDKEEIKQVATPEQKQKEEIMIARGEIPQD